MNEKSDLPDDRAIPNDLSKKISEVLNNKSIAPINELADALDDMARDNTWAGSNPHDREDWASYLLEQIEVEA